VLLTRWFLGNPERGRIVTSDEYKFFLHRHWSLYESMTYSNYVCAKLAVWKSAGKQKLEEFLAKAGISLQQVGGMTSFGQLSLSVSLAFLL
jgi:cell division control protein 45